jgi:hypothetical protein
MNVLKIVFVFFILQNSFGFDNRELDFQKKLNDLELQYESKIAKEVKALLPSYQFTVSVDVIPRNKISLIEESIKDASLSYLPMLTKDTKEEQVVEVGEIKFKIFTQSEISIVDKKIISGIVSNSIGPIPSRIEYKIPNRSYMRDLKKVVDSTSVKVMWYGFVGLMLFLGVSYLSSLSKTTEKINESTLNKIHNSDSYELIKYVRSKLEVHRNIFEELNDGGRDFILGLKYLLPYLDPYFDIKEVYAGELSDRVRNTEGYFTAVEFETWIKGFCEKLFPYTLAEVKEEGESHNLAVSKIQSLHDADLCDALIKLDDKKINSVVFKYIDREKFFMNIDAKYHSSLLEDTDIYGLNQMEILEHVYNMAIDNVVELNNKSQQNIISTEQVTIDLENLSLIPESYLKKKVSSKSNEYLASILSCMSDSQKYMITKVIDYTRAGDVISRVSNVTDQDEAQRRLEEFLAEINSDLLINKFDISEKKIA